MDEFEGGKKEPRGKMCCKNRSPFSPLYLSPLGDYVPLGVISGIPFPFGVGIVVMSRSLQSHCKAEAGVMTGS